MSTSCLKQILAVSRLGLADLRERPGLSIVVVVSVASVVAVLLSMLSLTAGFLSAYHNGVDPRLVIVVSGDAQSEGDSKLSRDEVNTVLNAPGIERDPHNALRASAEAFAWLTPDEDSAAVGFVLRGVSPAGPLMRPGFRLVQGRMFRAGSRELLVGIGAQRVFHMNIGGTVIMPDGPWPIVGIYSADGNIIESDLMADVDTLMSTMRLQSFSSVLLRLQSGDSLNELKQWLAANPGLRVVAESQGDFYVRTDTGYNTRFFNTLAALVGLTMAFGALFGTVKILYALVRARAREIATLRAIGFDSVPVAAAVITQSVVLCAAGALLGAGLAWLLFDGKLTWYYNNVFNLSIPVRLIALAVGGVVAVAALAGLPPALRAARQPVADSLREV